MKKTGAWDTERAVALEGALSIAAATVTLTLATDVASTDADVKVSYAKPLTDDENRLEDGDGDGDGVANLTDRAVTNNTAAGHCTGHEAFECAFWQACLTVGAIKSPGGHVSAYGYSRGVGGSLSDTTVEHAGAAHTVVD